MYVCMYVWVQGNQYRSSHLHVQRRKSSTRSDFNVKVNEDHLHFFIFVFYFHLFPAYYSTNFDCLRIDMCCCLCVLPDLSPKYTDK
ncbi:hypothetical protein XELAEV_18025645mg [Xenopus laevis]|uniref:Uncharacterized protein n=1 Tax=Xenopus laevis TaxID=8355 RepID=A0A974D2C5_XENLA|nr:hypothetical protein XELAEV_18025645mg [Xenopus laevis]